MTTETPSKSNLSRRLKLGAAAAVLIALSFGAGTVAFNRSSPADLAAMVPHETLAIPPLLQEGLHQIAAVTTAQAAPATPRLVEPGMPFSFADLVEHVSPAVVTVVVDRETPAQATNLDDVPAPFRDFFKQFGQGQGQGQGAPGMGQGQGQGRMQKSQAMGSGYIIDPAGYVVTNNHVIEDGKKITVKLPGKRGHEYTAHLVGTDKATDVALLKLDDAPSNLPTVAFGDDHRVRVGDWVVAIGNPFGLGGTVTAGIVSSIGRDNIDSGPYTDYIQIDAPINQGNSGGPTFDLSGHVIGMNTAIFSPSGGSVGIGFDIPASVVKDIVTQLRDHGNVARGWLGVQIQPLTPDMAASLGVPDTMGAIVASVVDDSPAAKAGFKQGDVIVSLNGSEVDDDRDLTRKVGNLRAGDHAQFLVLRDGQKRPVTAVIEKRDDLKLASAEKPVGPGARPGRDNADQNAGVMALGMELKALTPDTRQQFNLDEKIAGVVVTSVDQNSEAADKGFQPGIVIMGVGNKMVHTPRDVEQAVADAKKAGRESVLLLVADPGEPQHYVALKLKG